MVAPTKNHRSGKKPHDTGYLTENSFQKVQVCYRSVNIRAYRRRFTFEDKHIETSYRARGPLDHAPCAAPARLLKSVLVNPRYFRIAFPVSS